jgi:hypothetical protein
MSLREWGGGVAAAKNCVVGVHWGLVCGGDEKI